MLPMGFGYVEGVTHGDVRHGTTTLFAALEVLDVLDVLDGAILASCKPRHRHQEFLSWGWWFQAPSSRQGTGSRPDVRGAA